MNGPRPATPGRLRREEVRPTLRLLLHPVAASVLLLLGVVTGRPALVVLAVPFAVSTGAGLASLRRTRAVTALGLDRDVVVEGQTVTAHLTVEAGRAVPTTARLEAPHGLRLEPRVLTGLAPLDRHLVVTGERWGLHRGPTAVVDTEDDFGFVQWRGRWDHPVRLDVHPTIAHLRRSLPARWVARVPGGHPSRQRGDGIEFAEPRPFTPGDPWRSVNWRITGRRDEVWVDQRHPERAADVLLFLDSFGEAHGDREATLTMAVRAAIALSQHHVAATDRVGLVDLGGVLRWIEPRAGARQLYRITETLLGSDLILTYADKDLDVVPVRGLPPRSLVIALTPLTDRRAVGALFDLRARGYDLSVIECESGPPGVPTGTPVRQLAHRLRALERDVTRDQLRAKGVAVARWRAPEPLDGALEQVLRHRQRAARKAGAT